MKRLENNRLTNSFIKKATAIALAGVMALTVVPAIDASATMLDEATKGVTKVTDIDDARLIRIRSAIEFDYYDYKTNDWYSDYVAKLVAIKGIKGYPDMYMRVNGTITRAEFLKIVVASIYGEQAQSGTHWASGYIAKAESAGILSAGEVAGAALDGAITRQEMAKFISLALTKGLNEAAATNANDVKATITDNKSIGTSYASYVYNAYGKGIITGYPDKSFGPAKTATRAEASAMLVRMLDASIRKVPGTVTWNTINVGGYVIPDVKQGVSGELGRWDVATEEEIAGGMSEIEILIEVVPGANLIDQWAAVEMALLSKIDAATVAKVMSLVKTKTQDTDKITRTEFTSGKYLVDVSSNTGNYVVGIDVYRR